MTLPVNVRTNPRLDTWLEVRADGTILLRSGKVEIGQGISGALAVMAASELRVPLASVVLAPASTRHSPNEGFTAGSLSIEQGGAALRWVCAQTREAFARAAAARLGVTPEDIAVEDGVFRTPRSNEGLGYGDLAGEVDLAVASGDLPAPRLLDPQAELALAPRADLVPKLSGAAFIHDLRPEGLLFGRVLRPAHPGDRLAGFDAAVAEAMPGVIRVVRDGSFAGVVAERDDQALAAVEKLARTAQWTRTREMPAADLLDDAPLEVIESAGHPLAPVPEGMATIVSEYERPAIAHASIAPSCAIAQWDAEGRLDVTSHTQGIYALRKQLARALGLEEGAVTVTHAAGAGCYGHNGADDVALDAALLARGGTAPVMVMWTRADDMTWPPFAAPMKARIEAGVDCKGRIGVWNAEVWSRPHSARPGTGPGLDLLAARHLAEPMAPTEKPGASGKDHGGDRNAIPLYDLPAAVLYNVLPQGPVRSSALRSLGAHLNIFAIESLMDELAEAAGQDPLAFRLAHLADPRAAAVLRAAAEAAGWDPAEEGGTGEGRGIAIGRYKNVAAWYACVVRVAVEEEVRVISVHGAVDTGRVIQPDGVRNQVEGGVVQSLSMTLKEAVRWDETGITTRSWADYPVLRFSETPQIETVIIDTDEEPLGAGECAAGPVAAAVANAVAHALALRIRKLPINRDTILAAIHAA